MTRCRICDGEILLKEGNQFECLKCGYGKTWSLAGKNPAPKPQKGGK